MLTGHCECGEVRFQAGGAINDYSHCHCSQCRRVHGAAFATFIGVARADFQWRAGEQHLRSYHSSPGHRRVFCSQCGSSLLFESAAEPDQCYIALGTVDGAPALPEGYHIFVGSKAPWYEIHDGLKQYDEEP